MIAAVQQFFFRALAVGVLGVTFVAAPGVVAPGLAAQEITVSAAASLTNAFTELKTAFEKAHPGVVVHTNFAASNPLLKQMQEGAPVDVFASADQETMDKAQAGKLIDPATRVTFAVNDLVMIAPGDSALNLKKAEDLKKEGVKRIAVGNPDSVPAGRYTREALTSAGVWETLQPKYVFGNSVRQTLDYVARGEVEAGFVYRTDALQAGKTIQIAAVMSGHKPVTYPIAVATTGKERKGGADFVAFVLSDAGQTVLAKYGFAKP